MQFVFERGQNNILAKRKAREAERLERKADRTKVKMQLEIERGKNSTLAEREAREAGRLEREADRTS